MKIIYLAAHIAEHPNWDMTYQDITGKRDIDGDMLDTDLEPYDVIIATPPCNWYSRALGARKPSEYAESTKHLLPDIIKKLEKLGKPYIVENVRNSTKMKDIYKLASHVYFIGRHTYFTNIMFNGSIIPQQNDFKVHGHRLTKNSQGGKNVHDVIEYWLEVVKETREEDKI